MTIKTKLLKLKRKLRNSKTCKVYWNQMLFKRILPYIFFVSLAVAFIGCMIIHVYVKFGDKEYFVYNNETDTYGDVGVYTNLDTLGSVKYLPAGLRVFLIKTIDSAYSLVYIKDRETIKSTGFKNFYINNNKLSDTSRLKNKPMPYMF